MSNLVEEAKAQIDALIERARSSAAVRGLLPPGPAPGGRVWMEGKAAFGDFACSHAIAAAERYSLQPQIVAEALCGELVLEGSHFRSAEALNGFINFRLADGWYAAVLAAVGREGGGYGGLNMGRGVRVLLEHFPEGPAGTAGMRRIRGGVFIGVLASLLRRAGYTVDSELYLSGGKMERDLGEALCVLKNIGVGYDAVVRAREHIGNAYLADTLGLLEREGYARRRDGALLLGQRGAEKWETLRGPDGAYTDAAYAVARHRHIFTERGYNKAVAVLSGDYDGAIKKSLPAFGIEPGRFTALPCLPVRLMRSGRPLAPGERPDGAAGPFLPGGISAEAARFFLNERPDSPLALDLDLAAREDGGNPLYHIRYAVKRLRRLIASFEAGGAKASAACETDVSPPGSEAERELIKLLAAFPDEIRLAALGLDTSKINFFLTELANRFDLVYNIHKLKRSEAAASGAGLRLAAAVASVFSNCLGLIGIGDDL